jgi:hypothetical protein
MNENELRQTLLEAAAPGTTPAAPPEFGVRIRQLSTRRKRRRAALLTGAAACLALATAMTFRPSDEAAKVVVAPPLQKQDYSQELAELRQAAEEAQAVADALRARRKLESTEEQSLTTQSAPDPLFAIKLQVETAAAQRFVEGERAAAAGDMRGAAASYERVVSLFPQSRASAMAQERLTQLNIN